MSTVQRIKEWWRRPSLRDEVVALRREVRHYQLYAEAVASGHISVEFRGGDQPLLIRTAGVGLVIPRAKCRDLARDLLFVAGPPEDTK